MGVWVVSKTPFYLLHQLSSDAVQEWQLAHITRRHRTAWAAGERQRCASVQRAKRVVLGLTGLPNIWKTVGRDHKSDFQSKHCYTLCLNRYVHRHLLHHSKPRTNALVIPFSFQINNREVTKWVGDILWIWTKEEHGHSWAEIKIIKENRF